MTLAWVRPVGAAKGDARQPAPFGADPFEPEGLVLSLFGLSMAHAFVHVFACLEVSFEVG